MIVVATAVTVGDTVAAEVAAVVSRRSENWWLSRIMRFYYFKCDAVVDFMSFDDLVKHTARLTRQE